MSREQYKEYAYWCQGADSQLNLLHFQVHSKPDKQ